MKKMAQLLILGYFLLHSQSSFASETINLKNVFSEEEVKWVTEKGSSSVTGTAFLMLENGEKKGCAGFTVELLPVAGYSDERIFHNYGNNTSGQVLLSQNLPKFYPDVKAYHELLISTKCNDDNEFSFSGVPKGNYYLIAFIMWDEAKDGVTKKLGGAVMHKIEVDEATQVEMHL